MGTFSLSPYRVTISLSGNTHPQIRVVYFNGSTAENAFRRHVHPRLPKPLRALPTLRLPSTSPAHAGRSFEAKRAA
jgi:TDG/mug DNA glycosylase family protein